MHDVPTIISVAFFPPPQVFPQIADAMLAPLRCSLKYYESLDRSGNVTRKGDHHQDAERAQGKEEESKEEEKDIVSAEDKNGDACGGESDRDKGPGSTGEERGENGEEDCKLEEMAKNEGGQGEDSMQVRS